MQTVKEARSIVKKHTGKLFMSAIVRDDTWSMQVLKADVLHCLQSYGDSDSSPVYTHLEAGNLYLHPKH